MTTATITAIQPCKHNGREDGHAGRWMCDHPEGHTGPHAAQLFTRRDWSNDEPGANHLCRARSTRRVPLTQSVECDRRRGHAGRHAAHGRWTPDHRWDGPAPAAPASPVYGPEFVPDLRDTAERQRQAAERIAAVVTASKARGGPQWAAAGPVAVVVEDAIAAGLAAAVAARRKMAADARLMAKAAAIRDAAARD